MGFSSQAGHVAFKTQSVAGTFPADFATTAIAMKTKGGALGSNRELLIPDAEIGGGRDIVDAYLGAVVFAGDYEFYARFNALLTLLYAALGTAVVKSPGGTSEVQTLSETGTISGGTYTLTFGAQTTTALAYNADAATVQAALEALSTVGAGNILVTGGPIDSAPFVVTFIGTLLGIQANITATTTGLTGTTPGISIVETTPGIDYVGAAVHTFTPSDAAQLPFLAVQERVGAGLEVFNYTDAVVNSLHLEADANGFLMGTVGMIAKKQVAGATAINPVPYFDNLPMVVGTNIFVTYNGVSLPAKSFSFDLTNNFEDDDYRLGSFYVGDLTPKRRELTVGVGIREQDSSLWRQATYGASAATEAGGLSAKQPLVIDMSTYEAIPGATPTTLKYKLQLTIPNTVLKPYQLSPSGDDIIDSDLEFQGVRPNPSQKLVRAEVTTNKTAVN